MLGLSMLLLALCAAYKILCKIKLTKVRDDSEDDQYIVVQVIAIVRLLDVIYQTL